MRAQHSANRIIALLLGVAAFAASGWALADPPTRVARVGYLAGNVSFSPAGENDWVQARLNRSLTTGDRLWTDRASRVELQVGGAVIRMGENSSLTLLNLDDNVAQVQLDQGTLNVRVRQLGPRQSVEVATPNLAFTTRRAGSYRIEVDPMDDATAIVVRSGQGEVYGERAAYAVDSRQAYRFAGTGLRSYEYIATPRPDEFERWASDRDRRAEQLGVRALRVARPDRLRRPRREWHLAQRARLRQRLGADSRVCRLDAVPRRTLGMGRSVGLDLGRRCALGIRRVSLRPLGELQREMGVGAGPRAQPGRLRAGIGRFRRRQQLSAFDFERKRRRGRVVPARAARRLPAVVSGQPRLFRQRQPQQHDRQQHHDHQRLQQPERDQRLCEPAGARRRRRRAGDGVRAVAAGVEGGGAAVERNGRQRAGFSRRRRGAGAAKRSRRRNRGGQPARCSRSRTRAARGCSQRAACSAGRLRRAGARAGREAGDAACACRERGAQAGRTGAGTECRRGRTAAIGTAEGAPACERSRWQTQRARQARRSQGRRCETGGDTGCTAAGCASTAGCPCTGETCALAGASPACASCTGCTGGAASSATRKEPRGTHAIGGRKGRSGRQGRSACETCGNTGCTASSRRRPRRLRLYRKTRATAPAQAAPAAPAGQPQREEKGSEG